MMNGLGSFGLTAAEGMSRLATMRDRNMFPTNMKLVKTPYSANFADGVFSWGTEFVHFDFYAAGKMRRITITREALGQRYEYGVFAPSYEYRVFASSVQSAAHDGRWVGYRTDTPGAAHRVFQTKLWERAAWNTINEWCNGGELLQIIEAAEMAYARVTTSDQVVYFVPWHLTRPPGARESWHSPYVVGAMRTQSRVTSAWRTWPELQESHGAWGPNRYALTDEQRLYVEVARDAYLEAGNKPSAPLHGLPASGAISMAQVNRVWKKLGRKMKTCGITPAMLREGMQVEREHRDVTRLGVEKTARIAAEHLCERRDYYGRLKQYVER